MLNWTLAINIATKGKPLTLEQAKALSHVLHRTIHPQDIEDALVIVQEVLDNPTKAMEDKT